MLFSDIIFGPIHSRRLGLSLGINLLPQDSKLCNFECIYCECGWRDGAGTAPRFNRREDVCRLLEAKLCEMSAAGTPPDVITFAGNGEPTMHPQFEEIIDDVIALRDAICPATKVSVLSNATMIGRESVRRALMKVDNNILKLDSAFDETVRQICNPVPGYSVARTVENMKLFKGRLVIQTMFLRGQYLGHQVDNTTAREVSAWLTLLNEIRPERVMIYTIDRATPVDTLQKVTLDELNLIAGQVRAAGFECSVAG